ncbi:hypothetical protein WJX74_003334 [Apatococcus lobatus]|uniref:Uncharacterized protein n=1 Tax=Apatococcus lobatus TaxID=904363 RepID=A0AAW1QYS6_9CHLO
MALQAVLKVLQGAHGFNKACIVQHSHPKAVAFFFPGDQITAAGTSPQVMHLQEPKVQVTLMADKFLDCTVMGILPSRMEAGSACYDHFLHKTTQTGEPLGYQGSSLKACAQLCSLRAAAGLPPELPTILIGFSKGGVVLNQVVAELAVWASEREAIKDAATPSAAASAPANLKQFFETIQELHYLDAGLNCRGAYPTDPEAVSHLGRLATPPRFMLHGTPRQWEDRHRPWIRNEKDRFLALLGLAGLSMRQRLHFEGAKPSLLMHFQILQELRPTWDE